MYLSTAISRTTSKNLQKIGVPLQDETLCHSLAVCAASYKKRRIQVLQVSSAQQPTDHVLSFDRRPWEIQVHTLQTPNVAKSLEGNNNQEITKKSRAYLMETNNLSCVPSTPCIFRGPTFVILVISMCLLLPAWAELPQEFGATQQTWSSLLTIALIKVLTAQTRGTGRS